MPSPDPLIDRDPIFHIHMVEAVAVSHQAYDAILRGKACRGMGGNPWRRQGFFFAWCLVLDGVFLFSVMAGCGRWTELLVGACTPDLVLTTSTFAGGGGGGKNKTPSWFSAPRSRAPSLINLNGTPVGSKCIVQLIDECCFALPPRPLHSVQCSVLRWPICPSWSWPWSGPVRPASLQLRLRFSTPTEALTDPCLCPRSSWCSCSSLSHTPAMILDTRPDIQYYIPALGVCLFLCVSCTPPARFPPPSPSLPPSSLISRPARLSNASPAQSFPLSLNLVPPN